MVSGLCLKDHSPFQHNRLAYPTTDLKEGHNGAPLQSGGTRLCQAGQKLVFGSW